MGIKNFRAKDFDNKGGKTVKTASSKLDTPQSSEPQPTNTPIVSANADPNDVPTGTTPEVLAWVGDDAERAQKALDVEVENDKPRKGLVEQLTEMIDAEAEESEESDDSKTEEE